MNDNHTNQALNFNVYDKLFCSKTQNRVPTYMKYESN